MKGGLEPIANSSVTLYAAGTSGYGSGAIRLGSATTNAIGAFTISSYTCPSANAPTYIIASGGNAGAGANSAIGLMEALGRCDSLRPISDLTINELTTVAAQWALAQFLDSTGHTIGTSSTNATGLNNAFDGVFNLADFIGNPSSFLPTGAECASGSPPVNCDGLERLDTIANILAACVESTGPASTTCGTLLSNTDSSTTTLAAAHVMATHLTANVGSLFALQNGSSPFIPHLSAAPDGFEIALNFAPSGANFNGPSGVAIDAAGDVWVLNYSGDSVTELTSSGGLAGNFAPRGANFNGPFAVAIDTASHVWVTNDSGNSVTELTSSGALTGNFAPSGANFLEPEGLAIDAAGNVWMTNFFGDSVTELTSSGGLVGNFAPSGADIFTPRGVAIDAVSHVWVANYSIDSVTELTSSGGLVGNFSLSGAYNRAASGLAIDAAGNVWVTNFTAKSVTELTSSGGLVGDFAPSGANFKDPYSLAIDAAGHVWVANFSGDSVTELTSRGDLAGNFAPSGPNFNHPHAVAIDAAGNVWVTTNSMAELIGAARPVLAPLVACLKQTPPHAVCLP